MKKIFKLEEVLSAIRGILLCDIGRVYGVLNFLTGESLFTHELPRAGQECQEPVYRQHPFLKEIDLDDINGDNWKERLAAIKQKYPNEIELTPVAEYTAKHPLLELEEMTRWAQNKEDAK